MLKMLVLLLATTALVVLTSLVSGALSLVALPFVLPAMLLAPSHPDILGWKRAIGMWPYTTIKNWRKLLAGWRDFFGWYMEESERQERLASNRPSWADDKTAQWDFSIAVLKTTRRHGVPDVFVAATLNHPETRPPIDARLAEMEARGASLDAQASFFADNVMAIWHKMSDKERSPFLALNAREHGGAWGG